MFLIYFDCSIYGNDSNQEIYYNDVAPEKQDASKTASKFDAGAEAAEVKGTECEE